MKNKLLKISIVGRTNAGKSTLINKIVGEKISIQNKKINTTQDTIIGVKIIKKNQFLFYDTPGSNFLKKIDTHSKQLRPPDHYSLTVLRRCCVSTCSTRAASRPFPRSSVTKSAPLRLCF